MFKSGRWRREKSKIKAVFRLHFQATQVPQLKRSTLTVSLIPEDVGKPTVRLGKAAVRDGTCSWENPIYETVKFTKESKTGKISEKIYHFIVSSGSSKKGFLGETWIDFVDFAEATELLTVCLPLTSADSGALLHVTIEKMQEAVDQREPCKAEDATLIVNSQDRSLNYQMSNDNTDINGIYNSTEDGYFSQTAAQAADQNESFRVSSCASSTLASRPEVNSVQNTTSIYQDSTRFVAPLHQQAMPKKGTMDGITAKNHLHRRSSTDWSVGSASDGSMADSMYSPEYNFTRGGLPETSDGFVGRNISEPVMLMRQIEVMELELQSLRKQVMKESKKGHDLSRKIIILKEERDAFIEECEQLKSLEKYENDKKVSERLKYENEDSRFLLEEIRKELNYEKDLNTTMQSQLQRTQDSNAELILAIRELEEMLQHKNRETPRISSKLETSGSEEVKCQVCKCIINKDKDHKALEELVKKHDDAMEVDLLKHKIAELSGEIELYKKDKENLEMHMEQLALNNENLRKEKHDMFLKLEQNQLQQMEMQNEYSGSLATIKELKFQVETSERETKKWGEEYAESLDALKELEAQIRNLEKELEKQAEEFENDLGAMTHAKIEQEQRAIQAEETLRKTRQNNATTAERLQEEFRRLSVEMASKFDENEKLAMNALVEANELRSQRCILEEKLQKADEELELVKDQYGLRVQEFTTQTDLKYKEIEKLSMELENKSKQLEYAKIQDEEKYASITMEMQMLRTEMERLKIDKTGQKEKSKNETEGVKASIGETEMLVQRWNKERDDLKRNFALAKKESEKLQEELNSMRCIKDEKETIVGTLSSKVESLTMQYNELKHCFIEEEFMKENLRKQVIQLNNELRKKEETIIRTEKKIEENIGRCRTPDSVSISSRNSNSVPPPQDSDEVASLKEKLKLLQEEVKLREAAPEDSSDPFRRKEKDSSGKTGELKSCGEKVHLHSKMNTLTGMSIKNGAETTPAKRKVETCSEREPQSDLSELLTEVATLKKRNISMEGELKDMQERYSEISLKFAEVEGERQQLVMTVRNLKNGKKN